MIDKTHDAALRSWVESANGPQGAFPIQNLPFGMYRSAADPRPRPGTAIGDFILDLSPWIADGNAFMRLSSADRREFRVRLSAALELGAARRPLVPLAEVEMLLPATIGDYTDFYASLHHATNVGRMLRPDNPLFPNYKNLPVGYHGRASSVVVSGTPVRRPAGQLGEGNFGPTEQLDYELEVGAFVGPGNEIGTPIPISDAEDHLVGICLLNDWSARDIQRWEYQPLGPFLSKSFATTISPWVITREALEPFRIPHDPHPVLPYLTQDLPGGFDLTLEVLLRGGDSTPPTAISRGNFRDMYWTFAQMITHHTSNGCPLRPGDLIGSGTVSGPAAESRGCLLERTWRGSEPLELHGGGLRTFLQDGDEVILRGSARRDGFSSISLGECRGRIAT